MRTKFVAGNWKMYKTPAQAEQLARELKEKLGDFRGAELAICPPYPALDRVRAVVAGSALRLGAQDLHWEEQGAFTGKVSWDMLTDLGVSCVIVGHSEQRQYFHETDETVNKKAKKALEKGLQPIICVGETLAERESNKLFEVVERQVRGAYQAIAEADAAKTVIAYEPVWAIGTGKTATPDQAQEMHVFIRGILTKVYSESLAQGMRIQYGGSVKPENAAELFAKPDIDGGLIGGASLKTADFAAIAAAAAR